MTTVKKSTSAQNPQDFMRLQDLLYLCLTKWRWFIVSLAVCLGIAAWYLLTTPPVYTRSASILIKDDSKGKSASDGMESFSDLGLFTTSTNVNNEMGTLKSPDLMREVVQRLHLNTDYQVAGRFHRQTVYGDGLPVRVTVTGLPDNESAEFTLELSGRGAVAISDFRRNGEPVGMDVPVRGTLNDSIASPVGTIVVTPSDSLKDIAGTEIYVSRLPLGSAVSDCASRLSVSQGDEKSNIITLSYQDVSPQRAEDVLGTLISVYNESWVKDKNQIAVSTSMFINDPPCTHTLMVFFSCIAVLPTDVLNPEFRDSERRAIITESLTGCASDDTTGAETLPTGTAFALPLSPVFSSGPSFAEPPLPSGIYLAASSYDFSRSATCSSYDMTGVCCCATDCRSCSISSRMVSFSVSTAGCS